MLRGADVRIVLADRDYMFVDVVLVRVVEVPVMQVIDMIPVLDSGVSASWAMPMIVL